MGKIKRTLKWFDISMDEKEAEYLREMHKNGWKFVKFTIPLFYKFKKYEPEDVVYQLDYNKEACENKAEYIQMFADCGWEYIGEVMGYNYFRKPVKQMNGEEHISSDETSKFEMIERAYKGRMIPLLAIFLCVICPQMVIQASSSHPANTALLITYMVLFVFYLTIFYRFGKRYRELKEKIN